ncbi:uncharacterized protein [Tenebrio molitor]|uniref:uncharacterized protein n=1 Tax=Tenebrio molitor TaxID=7067 RepID=UPI0036247493
MMHSSPKLSVPSTNSSTPINMDGLKILAGAGLRGGTGGPSTLNQLEKKQPIPGPPPGFPFLNCNGAYISYGYVVTCPYSPSPEDSPTIGKPKFQSTATRPPVVAQPRAGASPFKIFEESNISQSRRSCAPATGEGFRIYEDSNFGSTPKTPRPEKQFRIFEDSSASRSMSSGQVRTPFETPMARTPFAPLPGQNSRVRSCPRQHREGPTFISKENIYRDSSCGSPSCGSTGGWFSMSSFDQ